MTAPNIGAAPSEDRKVYRPAGPIVKAFHESNAFVRGIMGPVGSSKSTACVIEILRRANMQDRGADGTRRSRWAIIRNSYPELKTTTVKTWAQWCPTNYGRYTQDSPITHHVKIPGELDMEVLFLALDKEEDVKKLLSLELTGAWINEAREVRRSVLDMLTVRVGRYRPYAVALGQRRWSGIIMDTNPPDPENWWYKAAEGKEKIDGWEFFRQPSGLSDEAENIQNLMEGERDPKTGRSLYYTRAMAGKDTEWIKVYVHGEYGFVTTGQAVYQNYRDSVHAAESDLKASTDLKLLVGADFGLTPSAVFGQRYPDGRWVVLSELVMQDVGMIAFAKTVAKHVAERYPDHNRKDAIVATGDPAGNAKNPMDGETTSLSVLSLHTGWKWRPAPTNDLDVRVEVVKASMNRLIDGKVGFLLSPACPVLRKGFTGGYHRKFLKLAGGLSSGIHETPVKNEYSHPHDALQYLLLGAGEHSAIMEKVRRGRNPQGPRMAEGYDAPIFNQADPALDSRSNRGYMGA